MPRVPPWPTAPRRRRKRAAIAKTLAAEGCRPGDDIEFIEEDGIFELDNVTCRDGNLWEYDIDRSFNVIEKQIQEPGDDDDDDGGDDDDDDGGDDDDDDDDDDN